MSRSSRRCCRRSNRIAASSRQIGIEAQIETAAGGVWVREIAQASPRLEALIFGAGDYAASMRMPAAGIGTFDANDELYPGHRWHAAMHAIVGAARANGLRCIDGPYSDFSDLAGFERACRIARSLGLRRQAVHSPDATGDCEHRVRADRSGSRARPASRRGVRRRGGERARSRVARWKDDRRSQRAHGARRT